jgi:IS5 family transposase
MQYAVHSNVLIDPIDAYYTKTIAQGSRPVYSLVTFPRTHLMQVRYWLRDSAIEDALNKNPTIRHYTLIDMLIERIPNRTTILTFLHLLDKASLSKHTFEVKKFIYKPTE